MKNKKIGFLGIDPGTYGGIAVISDDEVDGVYVPKIDYTCGNDRHIAMIHRDLLMISKSGKYDEIYAVIEKVQGYIGKEQPASRAFTFGESFGALKMALVCAEIKYREVSPKQWQSEYQVENRKRSENKHDFKKRLKKEAERLFSNDKITYISADAILIAEYCRRRYRLWYTKNQS